jgi:hypothetical protein
MESEARGESQTNGRQGRIGMVKLVKEDTYSLIDKRYIDKRYIGTFASIWYQRYTNVVEVTWME